MTFEPVDVLEVRAWGRRVGAVASTGTDGTEFEFDPSWRLDVAPLLMPRDEPARTWRFPGPPDETFHALPPLLADSVPDRFGNALINAALAREGVAPAAIRPIDRLAYVGTRAMGALTFHPAQEPTGDSNALELAHLVEEARAVLRGSLEDTERTSAVRELLLIGTSAGGARAKAVLAWNRETNEIRAGGIPAPDGFEQWLLKFDGIAPDEQLGEGGDYGRTEYAYSLMARDAGIDMSECHLLEEGGRAHFLTRRFDRPGAAGARLHMQSLCALQGLDYNLQGTHDYASLFIAADDLGLDVQAQIFRRMVFNVLASNNDDHTKNHAFLMDEAGEWSLAPAYDLTFAHNPNNQWLRQHLMAVNGKFREISRRDMMQVADQFSVPGAKAIIAEVTDAVAGWDSRAREAGVSKARRAIVADRLGEVRGEM